MRNISFSLTQRQILDGSKTVTRRLGWKNLKPGTRLQACVKCMGLKPGEKIKKLRVIEIVSMRREPLRLMCDDSGYGFDEPAAEGFPEFGPKAFVGMFCAEMGCTPDTEITRIEFKYI